MISKLVDTVLSFDFAMFVFVMTLLVGSGCLVSRMVSLEHRQRIECIHARGTWMHGSCVWRQR